VSATRSFTVLAVNEKWYAGGYDHRGDKRPEGQDEIEHDAESDERHEPCESVTSSQTTLHGSAIGPKTPTS
jgi:hypothetical protein